MLIEKITTQVIFALISLITGNPSLKLVVSLISGNHSLRSVVSLITGNHSLRLVVFIVLLITARPHVPQMTVAWRIEEVELA